ncbi:MAG: ParB N-terminal domain-containing protein [Fibrobacter sp.]|nr:ParB N-terminal domain-containing protein [Fibrobacter sp.]
MELGARAESGAQPGNANAAKNEGEKFSPSFRTTGAIAAEVGLLNPITVRKDGYLVAGRHRLEACRKLGYIHIQATLLDGSALHAELAEIDENLIRNDLTAMEQGEHLRRRDEILADLGVRAEVGENQHTTGGDKLSPPPKTTADIAAEVGLSERTAQQRKQVATNIPQPVRNAIRDTPTAGDARAPGGGGDRLDGDARGAPRGRDLPSHAADRRSAQTWSNPADRGVSGRPNRR